MAVEEQEKDLETLAADESAELKRMLGEAEEEEARASGFLGRSTSLLKNLVPGGGKLKIIAGTLVFLLIIGGGLAYFLRGAPKIQPETIKQAKKVAPPIKKSRRDSSQALITGTYVLEPFFLPVNMGPRQAVRFVNLKMNFLLSNQVMKKNIAKHIGPIRQKIYNILKRKTLKDYTQNKIKLEKQLKKKIIGLTNNFLASGTGVVEKVFFTQFIIK